MARIPRYNSSWTNESVPNERHWCQRKMTEIIQVISCKHDTLYMSRRPNKWGKESFNFKLKTILTKCKQRIFISKSWEHIIKRQEFNTEKTVPAAIYDSQLLV